MTAHTEQWWRSCWSNTPPEAGRAKGVLRLPRSPHRHLALPPGQRKGQVSWCECSYSPTKWSKQRAGVVIRLILSTQNPNTSIDSKPQHLHHSLQKRCCEPYLTTCLAAYIYVIQLLFGIALMWWSGPKMSKTRLWMQPRPHLSKYGGWFFRDAIYFNECECNWHMRVSLGNRFTVSTLHARVLFFFC